MTLEVALSAIMRRKDELDAMCRPYGGDTIIAAWRRSETKIGRLLDERGFRLGSLR